MTTKNRDMTWEEAKFVCRGGEKVARSGWKNHSFVYYTKARKVPIDEWKQTSHGTGPSKDEIEQGFISIAPRFDAYVSDSKTRLMNYQPTAMDESATDWYIIK